jgi:hypothetical protein
MKSNFHIGRKPTHPGKIVASKYREPKIYSDMMCHAWIWEGEDGKFKVEYKVFDGPIMTHNFNSKRYKFTLKKFDEMLGLSLNKKKVDDDGCKWKIYKDEREQRL